MEALAGTTIAENYIYAFEGKTEVCPAFHFASLLNAFATVAGDKILYSLDTNVFVKTNLYQCLLGSPSWSRKSTALSNSEQLIQSVTEDFLIIDALNTREGFIKLLYDNYTKAGIILDEMNSLFTKANTASGAGLIDMLNSAYNSKPLSNNSVTNLMKVDDPTVSFFGAITPELLDVSLSAVGIGGGFVSRCIFWDWEKQPRVRMWGGYDEIRMKIVKEKLLDAAGIQNRVVYTWDDDALAMSEKWYQSFGDGYSQEELDAVGRIPYLADKLCTLLSFMENDVNDNKIHAETWERALPICSYWDAVYRKYIVKSAHMTPSLKYQERIIDFLAKFPDGATKSDLCKIRSIPTSTRNQILDALVIGENVYYDAENRKYHLLEN